MLLFSSALAKHKLTFTRLSDCMEYLPLAAKWLKMNGDIYVIKALNIGKA